MPVLFLHLNEFPVYQFIPCISLDFLSVNDDRQHIDDRIYFFSRIPFATLNEE